VKAEKKSEQGASASKEKTTALSGSHSKSWKSKKGSGESDEGKIPGKKAVDKMI